MKKVNRVFILVDFVIAIFYYGSFFRPPLPLFCSSCFLTKRAPFRSGCDSFCLIKLLLMNFYRALLFFFDGEIQPNSVVVIGIATTYWLSSIKIIVTISHYLHTFIFRYRIFYIKCCYTLTNRF